MLEISQDGSGNTVREQKVPISPKVDKMEAVLWMLSCNLWLAVEQKSTVHSKSGCTDPAFYYFQNQSLGFEYLPISGTYRMTALKIPYELHIFHRKLVCSERERDCSSSRNVTSEEFSFIN